jgi:hypothetical protein
MTGAQAEPRSAGDGRRVGESRELVARDVSVAVGDLDTAAVRTGGTAVTVGALPGADVSAEDLADRTRRGDRGAGGTLRALPVPDADRAPGGRRGRR